MFIIGPEANELLNAVDDNKESNELLGLMWELEPVTEDVTVEAEATKANENTITKIIYISSDENTPPK